MLVGLAVLVRHQPAVTRPEVSAGAEGSRAAGRMMSEASSLLAACERPGDWGSAFSEADLNAWLSIDLPRLAPGLLPSGWSSPAVRFLPRRVAASALVAWGPLSLRPWSVLHVTLRGDNLLEVDVERAGLGALPFPPGPVLERVARQARKAGIGTEIRVVDGRPRLLLQLPGRTGGTSPGGPEYHLEGLRLDAGELVLVGSTRMPKEKRR
jgi:hypothetical protein